MKTIARSGYICRQHCFEHRIDAMRTMSAKLTAATNWTDNGATFGKLNSLPVSIAILDAAGTIVVVNDAWKSLADKTDCAFPIQRLVRTTCNIANRMNGTHVSWKAS